MSVITLDRSGRAGPGQLVGYSAGVALLTTGAAILPTRPLLAGFGAVIVGALLLRAEHDAALVISLLVAAVALIPASLTVPTLGSLGAPTTLIGLGAGALWLVMWLAPQEAARTYRPVPLLVAAFVAANLASYAAAGLRPIDILEVRAADRGMITVVALAGVALLASEAVSSRVRLDAVLKCTVIAGTVIAIVGLIQFATGFDLAARIRVPGLQSTADGLTFIGERSIFRRVAGTTLHPIEFSVVLCMVLPLALHLAVHHSRRWYAAVATVAVALPMSVSRTAVVGIAAVVLVIVPGWPRARRRAFYKGAAVYLVGVRLLIPGLLGTIRALFVDAGVDPSVESRRTDYDFVSLFINERPLFGRGFGTFIPTRYDFLDNQYLLSVVETGFVGLAAFVSLVGGGMVVARRVGARAEQEVDRDLARALVAALAVVAVTSGVFDLLSFPSARMLLVVIVGCVGALWRMAQGPQTEIGGTVTHLTEPTGECP